MSQELATYYQKLAAKGVLHAEKAEKEGRIEDAEYYRDYAKRKAARALYEDSD